MENSRTTLEQRIQEASAGGSPASIGAQLKEKGFGKLKLVENNPPEKPIATPEEITEIRALIASNVKKTETVVRRGRGTKGDSVEIQQSIADAVEETPSAPTINLEKTQAEKDRLLIDLADLRVREKQTQTEDLSEETKKLIQENLRRVQKKISAINRVLPHVDPVEDQEKIKRVIAEYQEKKQEVVPPTETAPVPSKPTELVSTEQKEVEEQESQPPQNEYSSAMERIWKENEEKREAMGVKGLGETLTLEPLVPGVATPETMSLPTPNGLEGPHLTTSSVKESGPFVESEVTQVIEDKNPEQLKKEKLEKIRAKLDIMTGAVEMRAEKAGVLDKVRRVGDMWNKVPKRYKYLLAGGMFLSGAGAVAAGSALAVGALGTLGVTLRGLSGTVLFVALETALKNEYEKKTGGERSNETESRHAILAGLGAIIIAGLLPQAIGNLTDLFGSTIAPASYAGVGTTPETPVMHPTPKIEFTVEGGGTLWGGIEAKLEAQGLFDGGGEGQKTYMIDALKDKFAAMSPEELKMIGITSGDINIIHPGDHIDLTKVLGDTQLLPDVVHQTEIPSPEQMLAVEEPAVIPPSIETPVPPTAEPTAVTPQETTPADSTIVAASDKIVHNYVNEYFGTKGFFGFGAQDGMNSIDWKDPEVGFANQSIDNVVNAHPSAFPEDGARHFGIEDYSATIKMQEGLAQVQQETGVIAKPTEKVVDYLERAATTVLKIKSLSGN